MASYLSLHKNHVHVLVEDIGYVNVPTVEYLGAGDVDGSSYIFQGKNDAHEMTHAAVSGLEDEQSTPDLAYRCTGVCTFRYSELLMFHLKSRYGAIQFNLFP